METRKELPPAIRIAAEEQLWRFEDPAALERYMRSRGLIAELRRQAAWSLSKFPYADRGESAVSPSSLVLTPSATLNPFSPVGKCSDPACIARTATDFAQTVALYSEIAFIPDPLSRLLADRSKLTGQKAAELAEQLQVLQKVMPLLEAGVLQLCKPFAAFCRKHYEEARATMAAAAEGLIAAFQSEISAHHYPNGPKPTLFVEIPPLHPQPEHPLVSVYELSPEEHRKYVEACGPGRRSRRTRRSQAFLAHLVRADLERTTATIFLDLTLSQNTHSLLLFGSRIEPLVLSQLDQELLPPSQVAEWERLRTFALPWLHDLRPDELLQLRQEAGVALPRLRELLVHRVAVPSSTNRSIPTIIEELRDQVLEVEDEFAALKLGRERRYRAGMGALAMLFVLYGAASGAPHLVAGSVAAFLATLAHLRGTERQQDDSVERLVARPAYALYKGKQILERR